MVKQGRDVRPGDCVQFMGRFVPVSEVIFTPDYTILRLNESCYARVVLADDEITVNVPFVVKVGDTYRTNTGRVVGIVDYVDGLGFVGACGKHRIVYNAAGLGAEDHIVELYSAPPQYHHRNIQPADDAEPAITPPYSISTYKSALGAGSTVVRATCNRTGQYAESYLLHSAHANREAAIKALADKVSGIPEG